jgi:hypothetical protein
MLLLMCSAVLIVFLGVVDLLGKDKMAVSMMEAEFKALSERTVPLFEF